LDVNLKIPQTPVFTRFVRTYVSRPKDPRLVVQTGANLGGDRFAQIRLFRMIRRFVLLMAVLLVPATARAQVVTWTIDPGHTSTQFAVRHMVVATVRGIFDGPTGTVAFDPKDIPGTLKVEAIFNTKSIDTNNAERDADLRSEQFLNVAKFPTMKFVSKRTEAASPGHFKVTGDLTLRGVTQEVVLDVEGPTAAVKDLDGRMRAGAAMTTTVNRKLWGLQYNVLLEAGGAVVADEVKVQIDLEFTRK
jgi:polyisoprenoid-binding protein YceI